MNLTLDMIKENDLIEIRKSNIYKTYKVDYDELAYNYDEVIDGYFDNDLVVDILEYITAVYRKQNDDYICIWKKGEK